MLHAATVFTRISGVASMVGLLLIALMTALDVALRWFFSSPLDGQSDLTEVLLPIVVATAFVSSAWGRPQIGIRFAGALIGPIGRRILDFLSDISIAAFFGLIAYQFWHYAAEMADESRETMVVGIPLYPFWYVVAVVMTLTALIQALNAFVLREAPASGNDEPGASNLTDDTGR